MANWKKVIVSGSVAELASLSLDTALTVANGGTGTSTLTDGGVLLGSGAGAVTALGQATDGQLVIGSTGGDPTLATLTQGTGVTISNTAGGIEISAAGTGGTVTEVDATGTVNGITLTTSPIGGIVGIGDVVLGGTLLVDLAADVGTSLLPIANGGTNISTYAVGDILYASALNTLSKLNIGSTGEVLSVSAGGVVEWTAPTTGDITAISLATNGGLVGTSLAGPIPQLSASIAAFSAEVVDVSTDSFAFLDATDGLTKKESIGDFIGLIDGTGLTATSGVLSVDYGSTAGTAAQGDTVVSFLGTANEVELSTNTFTTVGGGGSVTIGLPDDVTITNNLTVANNAVISGDLTVSGTASFTHSDNLDIADKFITLASGSTPGGSGPSDGGFVVAQDAVGSKQVGEALGLNISAAGNGRWGITGSFSNNAGSIVPLDYLVTTRATATSPGTTAPVYGGSTDGYGNMHVDTNLGDIYIYA